MNKFLIARSVTLRAGWLVSAVAVLFLQACSGGGGSAGFTDVPDLALNDLQVEGEQLLLADEPLVAFDPDVTGPYFVETLSTVESLNLIVTFDALDNATYQLRSFSLDDDDLIDVNEVDLVSGQAVTLALVPGANRFEIRAEQNSTGARLTYNLTVNRADPSANLTDFDLFDPFTASNTVVLINPTNFDSDQAFLDSGNRIGFLTTGTIDDGNGGQETRSFPAAFSPESTDYLIATRFPECMVDFRFFSEGRLADIRLNGERYTRFSRETQSLALGENVVTVDVTGETGDTQQTYTFRFLRLDAQSDDGSSELDTVQLASLNVTGELFDPAFECNSRADNIALSNANGDPISVNNVNLRQVLLSNETDTFQLSVAAQNPEARLSLGRALLSDDDLPIIDETLSSGNFTFFQVDEFRDFSAGSLFPDASAGDEILALDEGVSFFVVRVEVDTFDGSGTLSRDELIAVNRSSRTVVEVGSAEELQSALLNAQPNTEISINAGDYFGVAGLETSGSESAHFFSAQSGTQEQPITVLINSSPVELGAANSGSNLPILELQGDHWQVFGLEINGGSNAIALNDASNNHFSSMAISNTLSDAIAIRGSSSGNDFTRVSVNEIQGSAFSIGDDSAQVASANRVWNSDINAANSGSPAIQINPSASATELAFNTILIGAPAGGDISSGIRIEAEDSALSFNDIFVDEDASLTGLSAAVSYADSVRTGELSLNVFNLNDAAIPAASAPDAAAIDADQNRRLDQVDIQLLGGFDESFTTGVYQIQSLLEPELCLEFSDSIMVDLDTSAEVDDIVDTSGVVARICDATNASQQWEFENTGDGFVNIFMTTVPDGSVNGESERRLLIATDSLVSLAALTASVAQEGFETGFVFRWRFELDVAGGLNLRSLSTLEQAIGLIELDSDSFPNENFSAASRPREDTDNFRFELIPVN